MARHSGRELLLQVEQTPGIGTYIDVGGLRTKEMKFANEAVDTTNDDDDGVRSLLEGGGIRGLDITGSGIFVNDAAFAVVEAAARADTHLNFRITLPGVDVEYTGAFMIAEFTITGEYNGAVQYNISLQSSGDITIS